MLLQMTLFHSFWWLSSIPLYTCTTSPLSIHLSLDICFHVLAIVNSASVNIGMVHVSFWIKVLLDICLGVGLLNNIVVLFLVFWGTSTLFSIVAVPTYIPTNSRGEFPFLHILSSICYLQTFKWWPFWLMWSGTSL